MAALKLKYIEHPAFAQHTPPQWVAIIEAAQALRAAYTGPRTNIFAHIDSAIAGKRAPAPMCPVGEMEIKFFPRDVVGKQPTKVGAAFKALFFGGLCSFRTVSLSNGCIFAVLA